MPIIEAKDITYQYGKSSGMILNGVSLSFEAGKSYAVLGKSGSGKTTLLSLLAGLDVCQSGHILYKGKDLKRMDRNEFRAKKTGVVFQQFNLLHKYNAVENIMIALEISKYKTDNNRRYAQELLDKLGISGQKQNRKITMLSGGEQQRVAFARAISHNPEIIIADEPTGSLDRENQKNILDIMNTFVKDERRCIIIATHSQEVAAFADDIIQLTSKA